MSQNQVILDGKKSIQESQWRKTGILSWFGIIIAYICLGNVCISDLNKILEVIVILLIMKKINMATIVCSCKYKWCLPQTPGNVLTMIYKYV